MKRLLLGFVLAASASIANAQQVNADDCLASSDGGEYCFDATTGANFQQGIIGVYLPGQDAPWFQLFNPNNPRTVPPNPINPSDPYHPIVLTRPGT